MIDEYLYLVITECPACGGEFGQAERFEAPVPVDRDISISAEFCPGCGVAIDVLDADWDRLEETEVARVLPTQEREEVAPDA